MKKTRRIVALLLILVLAVSVMSTAAFADGPESYCVVGNMPEHMAQWAQVAAKLAKWGIETFWDLIHPFG